MNKEDKKVEKLGNNGIDSSESFSFIDSENHKYLIRTKIEGSELEITINNPSDKIGSAPFIGKVSLDNLKNMNKNIKALKALDSINEFIPVLKKGIEGKVAKVKIDGNKLNFGILIHGLTGDDYLYLLLYQGKIDKDQIILELCQKVNDMEDRLKKVEIHLFGDPNLPMQSAIIKKKNQVDFLKDAIKNKIGKQVNEFKRVYQATVDGDTTKQLQTKCQGITNALMIIKTNDNHIFGGFTPVQLNFNTNNYVDNNQTFVYSINNMEVYNYTNDGDAVYLYSNYSLTFGGGHDISLDYSGGSFLNRKKNDTYCSQNSFNYNGKSYALAGTSNYVPTEVEIFTVKTE